MHQRQLPKSWAAADVSLQFADLNRTVCVHTVKVVNKLCHEAIAEHRT